MSWFRKQFQHILSKLLFEINSLVVWVIFTNFNFIEPWPTVIWYYSQSQPSYFTSKLIKINMQHSTWLKLAWLIPLRLRIPLMKDQKLCKHPMKGWKLPPRLSTWLLHWIGCLCKSCWYHHSKCGHESWAEPEHPTRIWSVNWLMLLNPISVSWKQLPRENWLLLLNNLNLSCSIMLRHWWIMNYSGWHKSCNNPDDFSIPSVKEQFKIFSQ